MCIFTDDDPKGSKQNTACESKWNSEREYRPVNIFFAGGTQLVQASGVL